MVYLLQGAASARQIVRLSDRDGAEVAGAVSLRPTIRALRMRQVFQDLKTGETRLADVPRPGAGPGQLLIRSHASLVPAVFVRVPVAAGLRSGLERRSWVMADKIVTVPRAAVKSPVVGSLDAKELSALEAALRSG